MATKPLILIAGQRFGRLTVVDGNRESNRNGSYYLCECVCGASKKIKASRLVSGETESCGCKNAELIQRLNLRHGATTGRSKSPLYYTWAAMQDRCRRVKNKDFADYGGRGIKVCERWQVFENFAADMGERPENCSLDRINNNGDYEPSNCRWASQKEQCNNRRPRRAKKGASK